MAMRAWAVAAAILGGTGSAGAADLLVVSTAPVVAVAPQPTPMEWFRRAGPWIGQAVVVPAEGGSVRTIEWRSHNEVRARTESGAALTEAERRAVRALALVCGRGEVRDPTERLERSGTFVVEYDCARLQ